MATPPPPTDTPALGPIAFGSDRCDSCQMSIDHPPYATQATAPDGRVLSFDDLGCLVIEIAMGRLDPVRVVFRHVDEERWVALEHAGFVRRQGTPMDFGYGVVDAAEGELSFDQIRREMGARFGLKP